MKEEQRLEDLHQKLKEVETVVFVPATPDSILRKSLQEADEVICKTTNSPTVRFVERGGPTLMDLVGKNNPWSRDWYCPRPNCYPCQGRQILAAEEVEESLRMAECGQNEVITRRNKEEKVAIP